MGRTVKDPIERKTEIMDTAEELFAKKGFECVSVNEIINDIGIAKGTFYHYFSSKDELLDIILERRLESICQNCNKVIQENELMAVDKLRFVLKNIFMPESGRQSLSMNMENEKNIIMKVKLNNLFFQRLEPILTSIVEQGIKENAFETKYPEDVTQLLLRGIQGYINIYYNSFSNIEIFREKMGVVQFTLERILGVNDLDFIKI